MVGIVLQRIRVDGFTEADALGGFTALSFGDQTRNSAVTELGYQASLTAGIWQPFAKAAWNHELASTDRLVTASLTSIVAPSFSLPAVSLGRDWGTATAGTRVTLGRGVIGYVAAVSQFAQRSVTNYGGQFGLSVAFNPPSSATVTR